MRYATFGGSVQAKHPVVYLVPELKMDQIAAEYIDPVTDQGLRYDDCLALTLYTPPGKKKATVGEMRQYIAEQVMPVLGDMKTRYVLCADAGYYKVLTGQAKADADLGYVRDCVTDPAIKVLYIPNYRMIHYDPAAIRAKIRIALKALMDHVKWQYCEPGKDIIHSAAYPQSIEDIRLALEGLKLRDCDLACDIESFSLRHTKAGIGSIGFAWDQHNGLAFLVDAQPNPTHITQGEEFVWEATQEVVDEDESLDEDEATLLEELTRDESVKPEHPLMRTHNAEVKVLLRNFFIDQAARGKRVMFHNIGYDVTVLIYELFMEHDRDFEGMLHGLEVMMTSWDCTRLVTYLAVNSCAGNKLDLKTIAQEFAGNYAKKTINDIRQIPAQELLTYNLEDCLSTWFAFNKYWPTVVADEQEEFYQTIFQPAMKDIIHMQLVGMPVDMKRAKEVAKILRDEEDVQRTNMRGTSIVQYFKTVLDDRWVEKKNATLKKKRVTSADSKEEFNPNSAPQLQMLLYDVLGLPVLSLTKSKKPATDADTLKALKAHADNDETRSFLDYLLDYKAVAKINQTFVPAILASHLASDGWHYLFGNFNLGGTISGRLSSSGPNLQNLPATGSRYAKLVKSCFRAPPGWLFMGLDFDSLEDRISALTTKDPNKLKVYTDGYDGHCLRAFYYFPDRVPGIVDTVDSINSIKDRFPDVRQDSKAPTFALTYQGTWSTLVKNCGFTQQLAQQIEANYKEMYKVSIAWVEGHLKRAEETGYVTLAFGLRLRTPLMKQSVRGTSRTPAAVEAEGRSAGNALGQSWCLLNSRAGSAFLAKVRTSEERLNILPCAQIHDAQYYLVRDHYRSVSFVNEHLVEEVRWQKDPLIAHPEVKLGGTAFICYPDWSNEVSIPNGLLGEEIVAHARATYQKQLEKKKAA